MKYLLEELQILDTVANPIDSFDTWGETIAFDQREFVGIGFDREWGGHRYWSESAWDDTGYVYIPNSC